MLNLSEILAFKLKMGANQFNVAELLAERLMLAEALDRAIYVLDEIKTSGFASHTSATAAENALDEIGYTISFAKAIK